LPRALAVVWELLKSDLPDATKKATVLHVDAVLGLRLATWAPLEIELPDQITQLLQQRSSARSEKRWADADLLRKKIRELGYEIDDSSQGQQLRKTLST